MHCFKGLTSAIFVPNIKGGCHKIEFGCTESNRYVACL